MAHWFIDGLRNLNMGGFSMAQKNRGYMGVPFFSMIQESGAQLKDFNGHERHLPDNPQDANIP